MRQKIRHKASHFSKHGKHKGLLILSIQRNRAMTRPRRRGSMYESVQAAFAAERNRKAKKV